MVTDYVSLLYWVRYRANKAQVRPGTQVSGAPRYPGVPQVPRCAQVPRCTPGYLGAPEVHATQVYTQVQVYPGVPRCRYPDEVT